MLVTVLDPNGVARTGSLGPLLIDRADFTYEFVTDLPPDGLGLVEDESGRFCLDVSTFEEARILLAREQHIHNALDELGITEFGEWYCDRIVVADAIDKDVLEYGLLATGQRQLAQLAMLGESRQRLNPSMLNAARLLRSIVTWDEEAWDSLWVKPRSFEFRNARMTVLPTPDGYVAQVDAGKRAVARTSPAITPSIAVRAAADATLGVIEADLRRRSRRLKQVSGRSR